MQHSDAPAGGIAIAQRFPERRAIQIAVCDLGVSVLGSLRHNYPELRHDLEALKLAILPHVSGAPPATGPYGSSENAGLGLFFSKEIAWRAGGSFWMASGSALLGIQDEDIDTRNRVYRGIENWPGTLVVVDIPQDGVDDFGGILRLCREMAERARQLSGPAGLDFVTALPELENIEVVRISEFLEDVEQAKKVKDQRLLPAVEGGQLTALDFTGVRFVTQSFVHALLHDVFKVKGSLVRLTFVNCSRSTKEAIQAVAAYSAHYRQIVL